MCNAVTNAVRNALQTTFVSCTYKASNGVRLSSRPDQTRPEVFYRTCLVYLQDLPLHRHLGDAVALRTAEAGTR